MRFKNVKQNISALLISGIILSLFAFTGCGGGGGGDDAVTPDYTNPNLPLSAATDTQEWLIMYYCDADNDLEEFIMNDLNEMESVNLSGKKIKIIALVDRNASYSTTDGNWSDSRAYEVKYDSTGYNTTIVSERIAIESLGISRNTSDAEVNMGDGATLSAFIEFCNENYPANKKMLLFTNHGGGWRDNPAAKKSRLEKIGVTKAVCWDETSGADATLYTSELSTAVASAMGAAKLDIIAFDACLMAMVEVAYELKDVANYMVASEETIPGYGFPYTQILNALPSSLSTYTSVQFGTSIADRYYDAYTLHVNGGNVENPTMVDQSVTISLIDLSKISALTASINSLGSALDSVNGSNPNMNARILSESFEVADYVDIKDYSSKEIASTLETTTNTAFTNVISAFDTAVIKNIAGSGNSGAKGLSIFMPLKWMPSGEQVDYTSSNLQFLGASAASSWKTYLTTITNPIATDQNEIIESANGGSIDVLVPSSGSKVETGFIYYAGDSDYYYPDSDGTFNLSVGGTASGYVDYYIYNKTTHALVSSSWVHSGNSKNISYNAATEGIEIDVINYSEGYPVVSTSLYYTLTFTNN